MKKVLSAIMALCMILSICSLSVSAAPQGTAITSEADFLAMKKDGSYYLANDITITQSYGADGTLFCGYFDGNGKTVTLTGEPMFLEFCGQAKNLTIKGEVVADHAKDNGYWARGAFACMTSGEGTITLYNITNNANVTGFAAQESATYPSLLGNAYTGGIIGAHDNYSVGTDAGISLINCVNNGNIVGWHCSGGIAGLLHINDQDFSGEQTAIVTNCSNTGSVNSFNQYAGGIVGRVYYALDAKFTGCINNGYVTGYSNIGGIIGHTTASSLIMSVCQNNGEIATTTDEKSSAYAGGLIGYAQGTNDSQHSADYGELASRIEFCINTGNVSSMRRTGGIVGSSGADSAYGITYVDYCINTGNVTNYGTVNGSHAQGCAGGIQGYAYGSKSKPQYAVITNCITTGAVESRNADYGIAAYFLGYISSDLAVVANNSASGILTSGADKAYCLGWNNAYTFAETTLNNNIPATNLYKIAAENGAESTRDFQNGLFDITSLINGTTIANFNAAYKQLNSATADCMTQAMDGGFHPQIVQLSVTEPEYPAATTEPETTAAPETQAPVETTEAPVETTEAPAETQAPETAAPVETQAPETEAPAKSGCGAMVSGGAIVVALLGIAFIAKKREN